MLQTAMGSARDMVTSDAKCAERRLLAICDAFVALGGWPPEVRQAVRYVVFSGGKRLRPSICMASFYRSSRLGGHSPGKGRRAALDAAAACELVHAASLILDDLPCMDDATTRRARECVHVRLGEDVALMAVQAMLIGAFQSIMGSLWMRPRRGATRAHRRRAKKAARRRIRKEATVRAAMLEVVLGTCERMAHGQMEDLFFGSACASDLAVDRRDDVEAVHAGKTAALMEAAAACGALAAGGHGLRAARTFGLSLGMAFQIADDILDATMTDEQTGKTSGRDLPLGKPTYVGVAGVQGSLREVVRLLTEADAALALDSGKHPDGNGLLLAISAMVRVAAARAAAAAAAATGST